ncbi:MAG: hypothetical protein NC342_07145 [Pseudoflavonifractor sp.]|nr:hypothetical protein [Alloprevotella sp.]MCM1117294.1 hypothetical protein [Pseudoflavonifractor sp.]
MKAIRIISLLALFFLGLSAKAQQPAQERPVKWTISTRMSNEYSGTLMITATPQEGWHLYGTDLPAGGPQPTKIDLSGSTGLEFKGELKPSIKPVTVADPMFGINLNWWDKPVTFSVRFNIKRGKQNPRVKAKVTYMACDDNTCAPPVTEALFKTVRRLEHN